MKKTSRKALLIIGLLLSLFSGSVTTKAAAIEYVYLSSCGISMAPTINEGDTVRVKVCTNGTMIKSGLQNSSDPGDIIVYCVIAAMAYIPQPKSMWICDRAIDKYVKNGVWYFKTKCDNSLEPDPWEVSEYSLLGIVVEVIPNKAGQNELPEPSHENLEEGVESIDPIYRLAIASVFIIGSFVGIFLGIITAEAYRKLTSKASYRSAKTPRSI